MTTPTNPTDITERFVKVFRGRSDCYGSWEGGCVKQPLTRHHFHQHLRNGPHIGVYPLIGNRCSWGCIDIDGKQHAIDVSAHLWDWDEMGRIASHLVGALAYKNIVAHTERTANGIHVWVFPEQPLVEAALMRRALMAACKAVGYDPKEVNPKQETLVGNQVGNYVRLPYPCGHLAVPTERFMYDVDMGVPLPLDTFLTRVEMERTPTAVLERVAALWCPPQSSETVDVDAGLDVANILPTLGGLSYQIWRDGPLPGSDRSNTLARLAYNLAKDGLSATAAFVVLRSADQRWGKFHGRPDCDQQIMRFIERAYTT